MHRSAIALIAAVAALVGGCASGLDRPSTTPGPASPRPSPAVSGSPASPTTNPPPSRAPGASAALFSAAGLRLVFETVATVPGGPLAITSPRDGSGRVLVATKDGQVRILRDGKLDPDPMLDISGLVSQGGEQGLLGIAVHPDFPVDPRIIVDYTNVNGDTIVASYRLDAVNPDRLDPGSAVEILTVDQPFANHNGGSVVFDPDGMLLVGLGDGGGAGDPLEAGERLDTLLGKILRVDIDSAGGSRGRYGIPADNPFVGRAGALGEILLTGLRNPWRVGLDRATGDLWIGDVGQDAWEEIDVARRGSAGLDFGWDRMEGAHCFEPATGCATAGLTPPVTEYGHDLGCTVIGGTVYRGTAQPRLVGGYVFGDYCTGRLWAIPAAGDGPVAPSLVGQVPPGLAAFGEDEAGELFAANLDGTISQVMVQP